MKSYTNNIMLNLHEVCNNTKHCNFVFIKRGNIVMSAMSLFKEAHTKNG